MTGFNVYPIQQAYTEYLGGVIPWEVHTGGVRDGDYTALFNGSLDPYVVLRFSDIMPASGGGSFMGARQDEYYSYVDAICVASDDSQARRLAALVNDVTIGKAFDNSSEFKPNFGGGAFAVGSGERLPQATAAVCSFRFNTNLINPGTNTLVP